VPALFNTLEHDNVKVGGSSTDCAGYRMTPPHLLVSCVMCRDKQGDCCLYSSHDGRRDGNLWKLREPGVWLWWMVLMQPDYSSCLIISALSVYQSTIYKGWFRIPGTDYSGHFWCVLVTIILIFLACLAFSMAYYNKLYAQIFHCIIVSLYRNPYDIFAHQNKYNFCTRCRLHDGHSKTHTRTSALYVYGVYNTIIKAMQC